MKSSSVSFNSALMSLFATNLKECVKMMPHNADKRKNSAKYSVNKNAKRRISTKSVRNRGKKTKKNKKREKQRRQTVFEGLNRNSSKILVKLRTMTLTGTIVVLKKANRRIFSKLSKKGDARKRRPRKPRMIADVLTRDTRGNVKIA